MQKIKSVLVLLLMMLGTLSMYGQTVTTIKGKVIDDSGVPVTGANIYLNGTTVGTSADLEGNFIFKTQIQGTKTIVISFLGMLPSEQEIKLTGKETDLGTITLKSNAVGLAEVSVFANIAVDRKTPIPVSNIMPEMIEIKLGNQEYPEILKSTPGIYATKQGGAFGDSRINIRGFNSRNSAVMINGVPVNDMENGWVYWSNWAGLSDVTRTMQVQRGLGASKIAIPSVGGTINVLTKTTDAEAGGNVLYGTGNDGYSKIGLTLSSGLTANNWATTISLSRTTGDGYVDGTQFESYSYYFNVSKVINKKHRLAFSIFGAPQWHGQRSTKMYIENYKDPKINSIRYNSDWGYKDGQMFYIKKNYYHKPMAILNHFWDVNEKLNVSTAAYLSIGTGGGTTTAGTNKFYDPTYLRNNQPDIDRIVDENIAAGAKGSESILKSSVNNHFWTGLISTATYKTNSWLNLTGGVDIRYYKGKHYQEVVDLLGGEYFLDNNDINNPNRACGVGDKIGYWDDGIVGWEGVFGQAEGDFGDLTAFVSGALSNKSYSRVEYFLEENDGNGSKSNTYNFFGYSGKGGANYNINRNNNVFVNVGYFQNQPAFNTVFYRYNNTDVNSDAPNEKILSFELGYGFRSKFFSANVNGYYTTWKDKNAIISYPVSGVYYYANLTGIDAIHKGVEIDFNSKPIPKLNLSGMVSLGDWTWNNNVYNVQIYDENQNPIGKPTSVYIKGIHVGDAAQVTSAASVSYELLAGMKLGLDWTYYDKLYASFNPEDRTAKPVDGKIPDAWEMPSYNLFDLFASYKFNLGEYRATLIGNVNNLFDTEYISDATDGGSHDWSSSKVFYGWGRSWMITLKVDF